MKQKIDLKKLHLQSKGIQLVCSAILAVAVVGIAYFAFFSDQIDTYNSAKEKEEKLKQEFESKSISAANLNNLKEELAMLEESIAVLLKKLPTNAEIPSLIQEMHQAAAKNGLTMSSVTPAASVTDGQIQRLPFAISLTGNHNQIINFTRDVGRMSRIVTLSNIVLKVNDKDKNSGKLNFSAYANTYKALDASQPASSAASSDTGSK